MREILKVIDDMPREEQLAMVEMMRERWDDWYSHRFDSKEWWAEGKRKYADYLAANGRSEGYRREYL